LFVRGGSDAESKIIIDEMVVPNPYYSPVPDIKQRGRFDPFLFSGLVFSTGGYSAVYGQALSSILLLKSKGLADSTNTGGGIYCYGGNLFHAHRWDKTSVYLYGTYNNMGPYHQTFKQLTDWEKSPENQGGKIIFRHRFSETGIFKFYSNFSHTHMAINYDNVEDLSQKIKYDLHNRNLIINTSCKEYFNDEKWSVFIGSSYSNNKDDVLVNNTDMSEKKEMSQVKVIITNRILSNISIESGAEIQDMTISGREDQMTREVNELYLGGFLETNWSITNNFSGRAGIRYE